MSRGARLKEEPGWAATDPVVVKDGVKHGDGEACIKEEPEWLTDAGWCGVSEAAARDGLYRDHQVMGELVLGPEAVQRPNVVVAAHDGWSRSPAPAHSGQAALEECSTPLERLPPAASAPATHHGKWKLLVRDCRVLVERCAAPASAAARGHGADDALPAANTFVCDICRETFRRKLILIRHIKTHTETYDSSNISKVIHKRNYAANGRYSCECKKEFKMLKHLLIHIRIRKGGKLHSCAICQKTFLLRAELESHTLIHTGEKPFSCEMCKRKFRQVNSLKRHQAAVHSVGELRHTCDICKNQFAGKLSLKLHKLIHVGEKPYSCEICEERFTQSSNLTAHRRIHTGEKPYPCVICKKRFRKLSDLYRHKRIHTGEMPHPCEICGEQFSRLYRLTEHLRIHTGEKQMPMYRRPRKRPTSPLADCVRRKRGRPRKRPTPPLVNCMRGKRGRPRKRVDCARDDISE